MGKCLTTKEFIIKAEIVHGKGTFCYSKTIYVSANEEVIITCKSHDDFLQKPTNHTSSGNGCPSCYTRKRKDTDYFIDKANSVHNFLYDYSKTIYVSWHDKVIIICPYHNEFEQIASNHVFNKAGCPFCQRSIGSDFVVKYLDTLNIQYKREWSNHDCINIYRLRFDIYIEELKVAIEYNGLQHYYPVDFFGGFTSFLQTIKRDNLKREWCKNNNIKLLEIPYWYKTFDDIEWFIENNLGL